MSKFLDYTGLGHFKSRLQDEIDLLDLKIGSGVEQSYTVGSLNNDGTLDTTATDIVSGYIPVVRGDTVVWYNGYEEADNSKLLCLYNSSKQFISNLAYYANSVPSRTITPQHDGVRYLRATFSSTNPDVYLSINGTTVWRRQEAIPGAQSQIDALSSGLTTTNNKVADTSALFTCDTAADVQNKVVTGNGTTLFNGMRILVKFTYANTASTAKLKFGSASAAIIYVNGSTVNPRNTWRAGETWELEYNEGSWYGQIYRPLPSEFSRRTYITALGQPGYITNAGAIASSTVSRYFSVLVRAGETVVFDAKCTNDTVAIATSNDGITITPRVTATQSAHQHIYTYTPSENCLVYLVFRNSSNGGSAYLQIINPAYNLDPYHNWISIKENGTKGYISYSTGNISESSIYRYEVFHLYLGQMIRVRCKHNGTGNTVAAISTKTGDGPIVPRVGNNGQPNDLLNASYAPYEDCDVYVCYRYDTSADDCLVYIHGVQDNPSKRPDLKVNYGIVPDEYYKNHQMDIGFADKGSTTTAQVYSAYDSLLTYDGFTKETALGTASDGQTIYAYKYTPLRPERSDTAAKYSKLAPLLFIMCGQHGWEKASTFGTYMFLKDMFENHTSDPVLAYVHSHVEMRIVPVANPYGFDHNSYLNANSVNLNRNWGTAGYTPGGSGDHYGGDAAFDQPETAAINTYWQTIKDSCFINIDFHSQSQNNASATTKISWFSLIGIANPYISPLVDASLSTVETLTEHFLVDYPDDIPTAGVCGHLGVAKYSGTDGLAETYFYEQGNMGMTLEGTNGLPSGTVLGLSVQKAMSEVLGNFLMQLFTTYSK